MWVLGVLGCGLGLVSLGLLIKLIAMNRKMAAELSECRRAMQTVAVLTALKNAVEALQVGVTLTDPSGRILYTNPADAKMHGYAVDELIGKYVGIFSPSGNWSPLTEHHIQGFHRWQRSSVNIRKDGSRFHVRLMSDVVRDDRGKPIGMVTICEEEKKAA